MTIRVATLGYVCCSRVPTQFSNHRTNKRYSYFPNQSRGLPTRVLGFQFFLQFSQGISTHAFDARWSSPWIRIPSIEIQSRVNTVMNRFVDSPFVFSRSSLCNPPQLPDARGGILVIGTTPWLLHSEGNEFTGIKVRLVEGESKTVSTNLFNHPNQCDFREIWILSSAADRPVYPGEPNLLENSSGTRR